MSRPPLGETTFDELLDAIADESPTPASGFVSGVVVAMAAALTGMAARRSRDGWPEAEGAIAQAEHLRRRAAPLVSNWCSAWTDRTASASSASPFSTSASLDAVSLSWRAAGATGSGILTPTETMSEQLLRCE